jgi:hypothetical protein
MWELIPDNGIVHDKSGGKICQSHRLKVPGGWIVRTVLWGVEGWGGPNMSAADVAQSFVPDLNHDWKLTL